MMHETKWSFYVKIGDNIWSKSDIITKNKDTTIAQQRISLKVHQFVNELIELAEKETLEIKQPVPEPTRKNFVCEWELAMTNDEIQWSSCIRHNRIRGRKTVLDSLIRIKKDMRGAI